MVIDTADTEYDVIIVGAGMVGATLACALGQGGMRVCLLEAGTMADLSQWDDAAGFDPRVSALTRASQNILENLGVWPQIGTHRHCPFSTMRVWDAEGTGEISFSAEDVDQSALGTIVENGLTLAALHDRVREIKSIRLFESTSLLDLTHDSDGQVSVRLGGRGVIRASLVVGADGGRSMVRQLAGIDFSEFDYRQMAIVTSVRVELDHQDTAWQRFLSTGPLAFLPLLDTSGDKRCCSIVWSIDVGRAPAILELNDAEFCQALTRGFEARLGQVLSAEQRHAFPLWQRHARSYVQQGLALVGDAAHTIHPLAGQGVNLGMLDVAVLAEELLGAHRRDVAAGHLAILRRYQRRRMLSNEVMSSAMTGFKWLFAEQGLPLRWLRNRGMSLAGESALLRRKLAHRAMGLSGDLPKLAQAYRIN